MKRLCVTMTVVFMACSDVGAKLAFIDRHNQES